MRNVSVHFEGFTVSFQDESHIEVHVLLPLLIGLPLDVPTAWVQQIVVGGIDLVKMWCHNLAQLRRRPHLAHFRRMTLASFLVK